MVLHRPKAGPLRQRHTPRGAAGGVPIGGAVGMLPHQLTMPGDRNGPWGCQVLGKMDEETKTEVEDVETGKTNQANMVKTY